MPVTDTPGITEALQHTKKRMSRSVWIILFTGLAPVSLAALAVAAAAPDPASWQLVVLASVAVGLVGALFMSNKLSSTIVKVIEAQSRSEQRLRRLMELSGDWYWRQDKHQVIRRIVYRGRDQTSAATAVELPFVDKTRSEVEDLKLIDKRFNWDTFRQLMNEELPFDKVEFEYWPKGRTRLIFESTGRPLFSEKGEFEGYTGVSSNVTQKRLNEQLLSLQRFLLQGVLLSAPISELAGSYARRLKNCLCVHADVLVGYRAHSGMESWRVRSSAGDLRIPDEMGEAVWNSPEEYCEPLRGHDRQGLIWLGRMKQNHFAQHWSEQGVTSVWLGMKKSIEPNQPEYWVMVAQRDFEEPLDDDVIRILMAIRLLGLCVERRVFEDELQNVNSHLESRIQQRTAELMRSNSELEAFTYTVSHDLRAPLRAIDGFSSILREDYKDDLPEDAFGLLDRISNNARHMGGLIDGLLDFSRLLRTELTCVEIHLNDMLEKVMDQLDARNRATIELPSLPVVYADPVLLQQVWMNLVDNALKFSAKTSEPRVQVIFEDQPDFWCFSVKDNGAGFDMKYVDKLFNVFERLHHKKDFDGTGVGLAIVKRIIERHGGEIWAKGEVGKGAEIGFSLSKALAAQATVNSSDGTEK